MNDDQSSEDSRDFDHLMLHPNQNQNWKNQNQNQIHQINSLKIGLDPWL